MQHRLAIAAFCLLLAACTPAAPNNDSVQVSSSSSSSAAAATLTWTATEIELNGSGVLVINDFADDIEVSAGVTFGSSDEITGAELSPDGNWIAISIRGAAHDFGWLYHIPTDILSPVAFQYGGGVAIKEWSMDSQFITFNVTSPKPETTELTIDTQNLPVYPKLP